MFFKKIANLAREYENVSDWPTLILTPGWWYKVRINMAKAQRDQRLRCFQVQVNCVKYMVNFIAINIWNLSSCHRNWLPQQFYSASKWCQAVTKLTSSCQQSVVNLSETSPSSTSAMQWCQQLASWHLPPPRSHQSSLQSIRLRSTWVG